MAEGYALYQATASALSQLGPRRKAIVQQAVAHLRDARASAQDQHAHVQHICCKHEKACSEAEGEVGEVLGARQLCRLKLAVEASAGYVTFPGDVDEDRLQVLVRDCESIRQRIGQLASRYSIAANKQAETVRSLVIIGALSLLGMGALLGNRALLAAGIVILSIEGLVLAITSDHPTWHRARSDTR